MFNWIKTAYQKAWDWVKNSGTVLLARAHTLAGFLIAAAGAIDWSSLLSYSIEPGYNWKNAVILGGTLALQGIVIEVVRRRNTIEVDSHLIPVIKK